MIKMLRGTIRQAITELKTIGENPEDYLSMESYAEPHRTIIDPEMEGLKQDLLALISGGLRW